MVATERSRIGSEKQGRLSRRCASGIGRATARALAREGARLMIVDANATGLEEVHAELAGNGADVDKSVIDIADPDAVTRSIEATVSAFRPARSGA